MLAVCLSAFNHWCFVHVLGTKPFLYKYFADKLPSDYDCPKLEVPLSRLDVPGFPCIIGNVRKNVFVVSKFAFKFTQLNYRPRKVEHNMVSKKEGIFGVGGFSYIWT